MKGYIYSEYYDVWLLLGCEVGSVEFFLFFFVLWWLICICGEYGGDCWENVMLVMWFDGCFLRFVEVF